MKRTEAFEWWVEILGVALMLLAIVLNEYEVISTGRCIGAMTLGAMLGWQGQQWRSRRVLESEAARMRRVLGELANWKTRTIELTQANAQLRAALFKMTAERAEYIRTGMN